MRSGHGANNGSIENHVRVCILIHMKSAGAIKLLEADGWREIRVPGSQHHFKHPTKPG